MKSATTVPVFDPKNQRHWANVLHNAARVPETDPDYANARAVVQQALGMIGDLNAQANAKEGVPGLLPSAAVAFGQGASLGAATPIGNALTPQALVRGFGNMEGAAGRASAPTVTPDTVGGANTAYLAAARQAHPIATTVSDLAGMAATGMLASPLVAGAGPTLGGVVLGGSTSAVRGAFEPLEGFTRAESAALLGAGGAALGGVSGYVVGKFINKVLPGLRAIGRNIRKALPNAPTNELANITEEAVRREILKQFPNLRPDVLERTVQAWRTGKVVTDPIPAPPQPPAPPTMRPGETITPFPDPRAATIGVLEGPKPGINVGGSVAPAKQGGPTTSFWEQLYGPRVGRMPDIGRGQTLPYYPRGGKVEQSFGVQPTTSPSVSGPVDPDAQMATIIQYLRSLRPEQVPDAIAGAQALGINLGGTPEQVMALLLGGAK